MAEIQLKTQNTTSSTQKMQNNKESQFLTIVLNSPQNFGLISIFNQCWMAHFEIWPQIQNVGDQA